MLVYKVNFIDCYFSEAQGAGEKEVNYKVGCFWSAYKGIARLEHYVNIFG